MLAATKPRRPAAVAADPGAYFATLSAAMGGLPRSYVAFDFETTGLSPLSPETLIAQIGYCQVIDGEMTDSQSFYINWFENASAEQTEWLRGRLAHVASEMAAKGNTYDVSEAMLRDCGMSPKTAMEMFFEYLRASVKAGDYLIGFNNWTYDVPLFERQLLDTLNVRTAIPRNHILDVGLFELARRISHPIDRSRFDSASWFESVSRQKGRAQWRLDTVTAPFYLPDTVREKAHDAEYDSIITHRVFEQMKARATGTNTNADPATKPKESKHEPDQPGFLF